MDTRIALTAFGVLFAATIPAKADYYIVQEPDTHKCKVVETIPQDETWVRVGNHVFKTQEEADSQLTVVCKDTHDD